MSETTETERAVADAEELAAQQDRECSGQHRGIGSPECPRQLHHHHDEKCEAGKRRAASLRHLIAEIGKAEASTRKNLAPTVVMDQDTYLKLERTKRIVGRLHGWAAWAVNSQGGYAHARVDVLAILSAPDTEGRS